jgi:hypothetical protein
LPDEAAAVSLTILALHLEPDMGHDASKEVQARQAANLKAFDQWIASTGKMILPIPNRAVIYAGYPPGELMKASKLLGSHAQLERMWQIIEKVDKQIKDLTGQVTYDKLNDVLKRLKSPLPKLIEATGANAGHPKKFSDMLSCAETLTDARWAVIDKGKFNYVWDTLSAEYVKNSKGDVQIWEGRLANYKQINVATTLIRTELKALVTRKDLPPATLKAASELVVRYVEHHKEQKIYSDKLVEDALKVLKDAKKR